MLGEIWMSFKAFAREDEEMGLVIPTAWAGVRGVGVGMGTIYYKSDSGDRQS